MCGQGNHITIALLFSSLHHDMTVMSVLCWPPVLLNGCDQICRIVSQKLLDSAKSLDTNFQLKTAKSSEILLKIRYLNMDKRNLWSYTID